METNHNTIKSLLAGAVAALTLGACTPHLMHPVPSTPMRPEPARCVVVPFERVPAGSDYRGGNPGEWVAENGDGRVVGYAQEEDSIIYTTRTCALESRTYHD